MGERKVLNKYFPPDFDPWKLPRRKQQKQVKVRMMLPMSICCKTCGNYIYKGTKFNSRKEIVLGETYLGATRNFETWHAKEEDDEDEAKDVVKSSLEKKTLDSKREMDILAALDEMKSIKSRHATVSVDAMLDALQHRTTEEEKAKKKKKKKLEEDEAYVISKFYGSRSTRFVRRIQDDEDFEETSTHAAGSKRRKVFGEQRYSHSNAVLDPKMPKFIFKSSSATISVIKKPALVVASDIVTDQAKEENKKDKDKSAGFQSLLQNYNDNDDDDQQQQG